MSFDPRSLERLKELGRSLPEPIAPPQQNPARPLKATEKRHRIETEDNPERLFQELMKCSSFDFLCRLLVVIQYRVGLQRFRVTEIPRAETAVQWLE